MRAASLVLVAALVACGGGPSDVKPSVRAGGAFVAPVDFWSAVDTGRVAVVHGHPRELAVVDATGRGWSRPVDCPQIIDITAAPDVVTLRCLADRARLWTLGFRASDGEGTWRSVTLEGRDVNGGRAHSKRVGALVLEVSDQGVEAVEAATGNVLWKRGPASGVYVLGADVVEDHVLHGDRVSLASGAVVEAEVGEVCGSIDEGGGAVFTRTGGAVVKRTGQGSTTLADAPALAAFEAAYGRLVGCGARGDRAVLVFDHDATNNVVVLAAGEEPTVIPFPGTSGGPSRIGWGRALPRRWAVATKAGVALIDLDAGKVEDTFRAAGGAPTAARVVARVRDRWLLRDGAGLVAIDGETGEVSGADDASAKRAGAWLEEFRASAGDLTWVAKDVAGGIAVVPLALDASAPSAGAWRGRRVADP